MTTKLFLSGTLVFAASVASPAALAGEVRIGVFKHDVEIAGLGGVREKEASEAIELEYRFDSPDIFEAIWSPKPYVYASGNLSGNTNHAGAGLAWQKGFTENFYGEFTFGLAVHDGEERVPDPIDSEADLGEGATDEEIRAEIARRFELKDNTIEFGSRALFRSQLAVGYQLNDKWSTELVYEHLSNGEIIGGPENEGLDNVGLRLAYKY